MERPAWRRFAIAARLAVEERGELGRPPGQSGRVEEGAELYQGESDSSAQRAMIRAGDDRLVAMLVDLLQATRANPLGNVDLNSIDHLDAPSIPSIECLIVNDDRGDRGSRSPRRAPSGRGSSAKAPAASPAPAVPPLPRAAPGSLGVPRPASCSAGCSAPRAALAPCAPHRTESSNSRRTLSSPLTHSLGGSSLPYNDKSIQPPLRSHRRNYAIHRRGRGVSDYVVLRSRFRNRRGDSSPIELGGVG